MSAGAIGGASTVTNELVSGRFGELGTEDFIKVMMSELSNQDPFNPQDSSALLEQLSSLRNIESQLALQQQLENLVEQNEQNTASQLSMQQQLSSFILQNQLTTAGGLIDKFAVGLDANNAAVVGQITSVRVQDGQAMLELDTGRVLPMDRVTRIADSSDELIGKLVTGLDENNQPIEGLVTSVRVQNGQAVLELDNGSALPIEHLTLVVDPSNELIGKQVAGLNQNNQPIQGLVMSVRVQDGTAVLELDNGKLLPMDRLTQITDATG